MDWKKMSIEVRWGLITIVLACLVYDFSSPALSLSISVITDFMAMVVGAWRSGLYSETFWILSAVLSTWSMLQALCVSLSLNVWARLEWTFWTQAFTKGMLSCKKCRSAWWVWLRGVSRGGDTMEEERVTTYMSSSPIHLHSFGGFFTVSILLFPP